MASVTLDPVLAVTSATGQATWDQAVAWIAEGHPLRKDVDLHRLLQALVKHPARPSNREQAIRRLVRLLAQSDLDPSTALLQREIITPFEHYRQVLELLAQKSPTHQLSGMTPDSVVAAQRGNRFTIEVLCAVAGISYRDLRDRLGDQIPSEPQGKWTPQAFASAFQVIDSIVSGTSEVDVAGAAPMRPIELLLGGWGSTGSGWEQVERMRTVGVPYEILLAQRVVGSAWGAHRNRTSSKVVEVVAESLCQELDKRQITYQRSSAVGGSVSPAEIKRLTGAGKHIGVVVLNQCREAIYNVVFSAARDGGTARKNAGRLQATVDQTHVTTGIVVAGPGWAARNETAELAIAFGGQLYSDRSIHALVDNICGIL